MTILTTLNEIFQHNPDAVKPLNWLDYIALYLKQLISGGGILVIFFGSARALMRCLNWRMHKQSSSQLNAIRESFGQTILLGLEFIIAAEVIETTIEPDYYSAGILILVVIIRMILSVSLSKELELGRMHNKES